jgi:hypothetical protein
MYGKEPRLPDERTQEVLKTPPSDREIELLRERRLEHLQDLVPYREEATAKAEERMAKEAARCEDDYREDPLGPGDFVLRQHEALTKLHLRWDGPFVVRNTTDKNVFQLQTRNGYVLRHLYNKNHLR